MTVARNQISVVVRSIQLGWTLKKPQGIHSSRVQERLLRR